MKYLIFTIVVILLILLGSQFVMSAKPSDIVKADEVKKIFAKTTAVLVKIDTLNTAAGSAAASPLKSVVEAIEDDLENFVPKATITEYIFVRQGSPEATKTNKDYVLNLIFHRAEYVAYNLKIILQTSKEQTEETDLKTAVEGDRAAFEAYIKFIQDTKSLFE
ncbi:076L [Cherax quadricarinatus iridovirus]|uniref:Uncharacterized protein n=1 Tax=Shrimp hemocyte iridescent virus TaxID=2039780 RepID=A0A291B0R4_9VIRU|nr:076L [Cherax quadricarinatus iridovirus]YP_010084828.1 hypothetical protein KM509_gp076 [Shrimp hemocyte iridescent virus]UPA43391.1 hypothetical protein 4TH000117 [Iridovirus CN01]ASZ85056.1 076L [Cherax quadricarinatus iridovirus]ATE87085.1 hypothetical protein [Shrimp hemocyte iridescent virus]UPA43467.1 hypothetical protein 3TG000034 [Iridovirus CN01]UPA43662.1 hypothetical protein 1DG000070 [Iridovirus CN01]